MAFFGRWIVHTMVLWLEESILLSGRYLTSMVLSRSVRTLQVFLASYISTISSPIVVQLFAFFPAHLPHPLNALAMQSTGTMGYHG